MRLLRCGRVARSLGVAGVLVGVAASVAVSLSVQAEEKSSGGQNLLKVDWADPEIAAFKADARKSAEGAGALRSASADTVRLPILAFGEVPQIVKNVAGPDAQPIKPRSIISDPKQPYWYHLVDSYDGITIAINADRRVNIEGDSRFQIGAANVGAAGTLGKAATKPKISIFDNSKEEGMEGLVIEYTVLKFPDIPYTVTIECSEKAKTQCKDLAVITKDQELLKVVGLGRP